MRGRLAATALVAALGWLGAAAPAAAQDLEVRAYVQPQQGVTDTTPVRLIVQVDGQGAPQVAQPSLNDLENLRVLRGPSTNTSFTWRNGRSAASQQLIWTLLPSGPGTAVVPSLAVVVDGRVFRTEPIRFEVISSRGGAQRPPDRGGTATGEEQADVFIRSKLERDEVWVGEPVGLTISLYSTARVSSPRWLEQPEFANFWVDDVDTDPDGERYRERVGGRVMDVYPLERHVLSSPTPGTYEIEPWVLQLQVLAARQDLFDLLGRGQRQTIVRKTEPLTLRVKPLPAGAPDGFDGAVGRFDVSAELDRSQARVNDAVALRLTVRGEGSLRSVDPPPLAAPPELQVYDPKLIDSSQSTRAGIETSKTWEWILVPLAPGDIRVPEVSFPYFDPASGRYEVARAGGELLTVQRGTDGDDRRVAGGGVTLMRRDLEFIKPLRGALRTHTTRVHERPLFVVALTAPLALVPLLVVVGRRRSRLLQDRGLIRARRARGLARKRLHAARSHLESSDSTEFHEEVARALVEYVADRFDRSATGLTYDVADELLASVGVEADLRRRFRGALETCDFARFVPSSGKTERREDILQTAESLVDELEGAW